MILKVEKLFLVAGITEMIEKYLLYILLVFLFFMSFFLVAHLLFFIFVSDFAYTPSVSALDATHTKILYADGSEYASSFIPEFLR